jgi:hypothetical protein
MTNDAKGDGPAEHSSKPLDIVEFARALVAEFGGPEALARRVVATYRKAKAPDQAKLMASCVSVVNTAAAVSKPPGA